MHAHAGKAGAVTHLLRCREATRLISQQLDRPLPLVSRLVLRVHLSLCDACTRFQQQAIFLREAARRYRR